MWAPAAGDGFGSCATEASEPRQVRKEAAIRRRPRAPQVNLSPSSAAAFSEHAPFSSAQMAPTDLSGPDRSGLRRAHTDERHLRGEGGTRLPSDRPARSRKDVDRAAPRALS